MLVPFHNPSAPSRFEQVPHSNTPPPPQQWQLQSHPSFIKAFMSSIRHGPITEQHDDWARIGRRLAAQNATTNERFRYAGLREGKVLIVCGERDSIVVKHELMEDAERALMGNVEFRVVDAGHEFPITRTEEVVGFVVNFWSGGG